MWRRPSAYTLSHRAGWPDGAARGRDGGRNRDREGGRAQARRRRRVGDDRGQLADPVSVNGQPMALISLVDRARALHTAFSDHQITVVNRLVTSDKVAVAFHTVPGTPAPGRPPSGLCRQRARRCRASASTSSPCATGGSSRSGCSPTSCSEFSRLHRHGCRRPVTTCARPLRKSRCGGIPLGRLVPASDGCTRPACRPHGRARAG